MNADAFARQAIEIRGLDDAVAVEPRQSARNWSAIRNRMFGLDVFGRAVGGACAASAGARPICTKLRRFTPTSVSESHPDERTRCSGPAE